MKSLVHQRNNGTHLIKIHLRRCISNKAVEKDDHNRCMSTDSSYKNVIKTFSRDATEVAVKEEIDLFTSPAKHFLDQLVYLQVMEKLRRLNDQTMLGGSPFIIKESN